VLLVFVEVVVLFLESLESKEETRVTQDSPTSQGSLVLLLPSHSTWLRKGMVMVMVMGKELVSMVMVTEVHAERSCAIVDAARCSECHSLAFGSVGDPRPVLF